MESVCTVQNVTELVITRKGTKNLWKVNCSNNQRIQLSWKKK